MANGGQKSIELNLRHHHDLTYSHILAETVPRYLSMIPVLRALPEALVAISDSNIAEEVLCLLGLDPKRILRLRSSNAAWVYASVLLLPPPPRDPLFYPATPFSIAVRNIMRAATSSSKKTDAPADESAKPLLLLIERGFGRKPHTGACEQFRCVQNFSALLDALVDSFCSKYQLKVYSPLASTAVHLFSDAELIVGVHGGVLQNMLFCKPGTKVVHIGWGDHYKALAEKYDLKLTRVDIPGLGRRSSNILLNVSLIVEDARKAAL